MVNRIEINDEDIAHALDGDARAIERIVRGLERPFYALARRMSLSHTDAEEAAQESLLRVVTHLSQFDRRAKFSTWAWRIAVNQCVDHRARRRRLPLLSSDAIGAQIAQGLELEAPERAEDRAQLRELKALCTIAMLSALDVEQRIAFVLGDVLELSGDEAAEVLGVEPAAFRKRLSRARDGLRAVLSRHCGLIDAGNACRCHRRLSDAKARGLLGHEDGASDAEEAAALSEVERVLRMYRADDALMTRGDLALRVVSTLRTTTSARA